MVLPHLDGRELSGAGEGVGAPAMPGMAPPCGPSGALAAAASGSCSRPAGSSPGRSRRARSGRGRPRRRRAWAQWRRCGCVGAARRRLVGRNGCGIHFNGSRCRPDRGQRHRCRRCLIELGRCPARLVHAYHQRQRPRKSYYSPPKRMANSLQQLTKDHSTKSLSMDHRFRPC